MSWGFADFRVSAQDKALAALHFESEADAYSGRAERGLRRHLSARERQALFDLAEFGDPSVATMIDVGCGGGVYALAAKAAGLRVTVVDVSPKMIRNLTGKVDRALVGDVECIHLAERYDVVLCSGVLDFVVRPEIAFRNLCELVQPGGRLVIQAPRASIGGYLYSLAAKARHGFRMNLFTVGWFTRQANQLGLQFVRSRRPLPYNLVVLLRRPALLPAD